LRVIRAEGQDPTEALVRESVARNWGLYHLAPERATLEDVFVQLTQQEGVSAILNEPSTIKGADAQTQEAQS